MSMDKSKILIGAFCLICANLSLSGGAHASVVPWTGYANYAAAPGASGSEDLVGPFSSYDFSDGGIVLLQPSTVANTNAYTVGDIYTGSYQSYVVGHTLNGNTVSSPDLNMTGSGGGYELTIAATFSERVSSVDASGSALFDVLGGNANLYFDPTPDRNFSTDSGFTDGASILAGSITGGSGAFLPAPGAGFNGISLAIGNFDYDHNVFSPPNISGGNGIFTLQINPSGVTSTVNSVMGNGVNEGDQLLQADGSLDLVAVPLPGAVWLLCSALAGFAGIGRCHHPVAA